MEYNATRAARTMAMLSHPKRLLILCHLHDGERSVTDLMGLLNISQTALSQHLAKLRGHNLVQTRRDAQMIYYSLQGDEARVLLAALYTLYCGPDALNEDGSRASIADTSQY
ncbi:MAG: metalloregulator ArsR/SmtB family transcription factor [Pseudomonadota bacterium]